ncbi:nucleotide-sugar transporter [Hirsutella rhossiliensis]|uniref:Nucleotide-sugar transporter domain-containing protein n=1 Tax=Hirsutella rhossiliensis TaxID=111463 RepID=A0A9P8MUT1_9HYPO|nr:nucleotide-sugar transporter domain-containing protein [Hirsutella rhossiliensis]KAH0961524.1 nucleotide-sugar transporter domain-containing protein [Hirsutella rhossiliensis]
MPLGDSIPDALGCRRWLQLTRNPATAAALGLVTIQVGFGLVMKAAQSDGTYSFSPSASVSISELLKMLLAAALFHRECRKRLAAGIEPDAHPHYLALPPASTPEKRPETPSVGLPRLGLAAFWRHFLSEVSEEERSGFYVLALCYTLINNSIFISYMLADPGTIQLVKSGSTFITAIVMVAALNTPVSQVQWFAVILQPFGLILAQYEPETGTAYSLGTYAILLLQVFLSAASSVYNQHILQANKTSLHANNMVLYAAGVFVSLICHIVMRIIKTDEPGFFEGYDNIGAIMVVVSNVFIGLAITSVYKYANAVVKCIATAVSSGLLLYLSTILFGTTLGTMVIPGTIIVALSSWLYLANPAAATQSRSRAGSGRASCKALGVFLKRYRVPYLAVLTFTTVLIVAFLTLIQTTMPGLTHGNGHPNLSHSAPATEGTATSPFRNTLAVIRWNSAHPERIPLLMKYKPFFRSMHLSIPDIMPNDSPVARNKTYDGSNEPFTIYREVANVMKMALAGQPEVDGLMYFHFDAWIDPMRWNSTDRDGILFARTADPQGPLFRCMNDISAYDWQGWHVFGRMDIAAVKAVQAAAALGLGYKTETDKWCVGWSDIYYVPRRLFADFIVLAETFAAFDVFHELAVPTIVNIIAQTRSSPERSALAFVDDCWGSCCASNPTIEDVITTRCGHRLDYLDENVTGVLYDKIDGQARELLVGS